MSELDERRATPPGAWDSADPLGEALHFLRMDGVVYTRSELTAPWGIDLPPMPECVLFHVVTEGRCLLEVDGAEPRVLQPGEFTLVPHGEGHRIASDAGAPIEPLFELEREEVGPRYEILRHGGGGEPTGLVCGAVRFGHPAARDLLSRLPRVVQIATWSAPGGEWMQSSLRLMAAEAGTRHPGGETVVTRLADILVIQAIRAWIAEDPGAQTGWLGALRDPRVGPAILALQREPERPWSVETLAREAGLSRSGFAERFRALVGETPMNFLARWRMQLASSWLQDGQAAIAELAERLGYQSEAAFSRAYKRVMGEAPAATRRRGLVE